MSEFILRVKACDNHKSSIIAFSGCIGHPLRPLSWPPGWLNASLSRDHLQMTFNDSLSSTFTWESLLYIPKLFFNALICNNCFIGRLLQVGRGLPGVVECLGHLWPHRLSQHQSYCHRFSRSSKWRAWPGLPLWGNKNDSSCPSGALITRHCHYTRIQRESGEQLLLLSLFTSLV